MLGQLIKGQGPCLFDNKSSIDEYTNKLKDYREKFKIFGDIEEGDKIGKSKSEKETYYISKAGYTQQLRRWWWAENRSATWQYLDNDFNKFFALCDNIKQKHLALTPNAGIKIALLEIINIVIPGLYNLKVAYKNIINDEPASKLCCKIDSIILTLIDTKNEINKKKPLTPTIPVSLETFGMGRAFSIPVQAVSHSF